MKTNSKSSPFKSGYIGILGIPNVGKSTLLNALIGEKLAIVSSKPQTTRNKILGILNAPQAQLLFLDTPGIHSSEKLLNQFMVAEAKSTIEDADLIFYLVEPKIKLNPIDLEVIAEIEAKQKPYFLIINKVDTLARKDELLKLLDLWQKQSKAKDYYLISATRHDGTAELIQQAVQYLPEGPAYYAEDQITDQSLRTLTCEIIREKLFELTYQEVPYSTAVVIDEYEEIPERNLDRISATIYIEKDSQKPIVIGKGGTMLKQIGEEARKEIEHLSGRRVFLKLFVKVVKDWTKRESVLKDLGYGIEKK